MQSIPGAAGDTPFLDLGIDCMSRLCDNLMGCKCVFGIFSLYFTIKKKDFSTFPCGSQDDIQGHNSENRMSDAKLKCQSEPFTSQSKSPQN